MIEPIEALRQVYGEANGRSVKKQIVHIDLRCARLTVLSPFVVVASVDGQGALDASPRGGAPGFVQVADAGYVTDSRFTGQQLAGHADQHHCHRQHRPAVRDSRCGRNVTG